MNDPSSGEANLLEELERLKLKHGSTEDQDIRNAIELRIAEIERILMERHAVAAQNAVTERASEVAHQAEEQKNDARSESQLRDELAKLSRQLYSTEDPRQRSEIQSQVADLQHRLGIDTQRLAQEEMPLDTPASTPKATSSRTTMADLEAAVALQKAKIRQMSREEALPDLPDISDGPAEVDSPERVEEAERLIQQARVEQMRNNAVKVRELLEQATKVAPNSPGVLEMLGDDYAAKKQYAKAMAAYRRAVSLSPKNVQVERKLANIALAMESSSSPSLEPLDDSAIPMASRNGALFLTLLLPGLGHLVSGRRTKGVVLVSVWIICLGWTILMSGEVAKLGSALIGGRQSPNYLMLIPIFGMLAAFISAIADFKKPVETYRKPVDRPAPPVNLPFE